MNRGDGTEDVESKGWQEVTKTDYCALPAVMTSSMTSTRRPFIAAPTNWPPCERVRRI
jgi:hypothetical protein